MLHGWRLSSVPGRRSPALPKGFPAWWRESEGTGQHPALALRASRKVKASQHPLCASHLASLSTRTPHNGMVLIHFTSEDSEVQQG